MQDQQAQEPASIASAFGTLVASLAEQMAAPVAGAVRVVAQYGPMDDGLHQINVPCPGPHHYDSYAALPAQVTFDGRVYGKSSYDSDRGIACYLTTVRCATDLAREVLAIVDNADLPPAWRLERIKNLITGQRAARVA